MKSKEKASSNKSECTGVVIDIKPCGKLHTSYTKEAVFFY